MFNYTTSLNNKYNGDKAFFYEQARPCSNKSSKLQELAERHKQQPSKGRLRGETKASTSIQANLLEESRKAYDKIIKTAGEVGITYESLLDMDIRIFNNYVDGYILRRETSINDSLLVQHIAASKIAQAVWGDKRFSQPIKSIKLLDRGVIENRNEKVYNTLKAKGLID